MAKLQIPDALKADLPQTTFGKILGATPVVMTVIATMLAGLASSEMTKAQYDRSLAAQQQSKAGDQWSFFQAKKLRSAVQHNTLDLLQAANEIQPIDPAALKQALAATPEAGILDSNAGQAALVALEKRELPATANFTILSPDIKAALSAVEALRPDSEVAPLMARIDDRQLAEGIIAAKANADAFDNAIKPVTQVIDGIDGALQAKSASPIKRDFTAARLLIAAKRYDSEARLNQSVASLFELQVHKSNLSAERHHQRSKRFFFGMLGAQMAVIISTFAMAARKRNVLWGIAATSGVVASLFAAYVYLFS